MSLVWDKAAFDSLYDLPGERWGHYPGGRQKSIRLGYHHHVIGGPSAVDRARRIRDNFSIPTGSNILHIGPGFGWTLEGYKEIGLQSAGYDTSDYIHTNKDTSEADELIPRIKAVGRDPDSYMILGPPSRLCEYLENFRSLGEDGLPIKEAPGKETNAEGYQIDMAALPSPWPIGKNDWLMPFREISSLNMSSRPLHGTGWVDSLHPNGSGRHVWMAPILDCYLRERSGLSPRTDATVIQEDGDTDNSRTDIGKLLGNSFDFIFSEHVITALTNDEVLALAANMQRLNERFGGQMIHLITEPKKGADSRLNFKTLAQWRALFDANGFIAQKFASNWGRIIV